MARSKNKDSRWKTSYFKEGTEARRQTRKKFRAQTKEILHTVIGNEDNISFPIDPKTTGRETH